jgi:hypothetical protein
MPGDNTATIAAGTPIDFPQTGPVIGTDISRISDSTFLLSAVGIYLISFTVSITEAGQLVINLNSVDQAQTVIGRATGTSVISQTALIQTTIVNELIQINNPTGAPTALTVTPIAGGPNAVSAQLVITRYS